MQRLKRYIPITQYKVTSSRNLLLYWGSVFPGDPVPLFLRSILRVSPAFVRDRYSRSTVYRCERRVAVKSPQGSSGSPGNRGPVAVALWTVSHFALRPPSWKQTYRTTRMNIKTGGRANFILTQCARMRCQRGGNHAGKAKIMSFGGLIDDPSSIYHGSPL